MNMAKTKKKTTNPIPLRLPVETQAYIEEIAKAFHVSNQDVIRRMLGYLRVQDNNGKFDIENLFLDWESK